MSLEKRPASRIPEGNKLPLKISTQQHVAESGESSVWGTVVQDSKEQERLIALKQIRREAFASDEEMRASKEFYDFLKAFPGFGAFVPDTLYFKARMTSGSAPKRLLFSVSSKGRPLTRYLMMSCIKTQELLNSFWSSRMRQWTYSKRLARKDRLNPILELQEQRQMRRSNTRIVSEIRVIQPMC